MPNDDIVSTITLSYTELNNMIEFNGTDYVTIDGRPAERYILHAAVFIFNPFYQLRQIFIACMMMHVVTQ